MTTAAAEAPPTEAEPVTFADVLRRLGDVPPGRVLLRPHPATEADLLRLLRAEPKRLFELVDGCLVEKSMGYRESLLAATLLGYLVPFIRVRNLGVLATADALMRLRPGLLRMPDLSFTAWKSLPADAAHLQAVADFPPDLAVDVCKGSHGHGELDRKRRDYFAAGTRLAWVVDPGARTVAAYTEPNVHVALSATDVLEGGAVLPGFALPLADLFGDPQLNPRPSPPE